VVIEKEWMSAVQYEAPGRGVKNERTGLKRSRFRTLKYLREVEVFGYAAPTLPLPRPPGRLGLDGRCHPDRELLVPVSRCWH
jgi:hypothetical protein